MNRPAGKNMLATCLLMLTLSSPLAAWADPLLSRGQTLYVPVYATIAGTPRRTPFKLATTLSIRNTDPTGSITVTTIDYYDTKGRLVWRHLERPLTLAPLESTEVHIPEERSTGGSGANFIVRWHASQEVNVPVVESVMIGMKSGQGISFASSGREIRERR